MTTVILRSDSQMSYLQTVLAKLGWREAAASGKPFVVEIHPERNKRSSQANRFYWSILKQISEQVWVEGRSYSPEVWHEQAKREWLGCVDLPMGGTAGISTSDLNTAEFAAYVEKVQMWAALLGAEIVEVA